MRALCIAVMFLIAGGSAHAAPNVVVTLPPLHSLTAAVMQGVGDPHLLLKGGESPHSYAMRPSDAKALEAADMVIWIGPSLEQFMVRPIAALAPDAVSIELIDTPGIELRALREGGPWEAHDHDHGHAHDHGDHDHGDHDHGDHEAEVDAHIWLDPVNAQKMATYIAAELGSTDPENAETYSENAATLVEELEQLTGVLETELAPVRSRPFIVFHDGFGYFEGRFGLTGAGSITVNPEVPPGGRRLAELRLKIEDQEAVCVFSEPQFPRDVSERLVESTPAKVGVIDPLGSGLAPGPALYPTLLENLAESFAACLSPA